MRPAFPCDGCGACCKSVALSTQTACLDRGDGVCRHYDDAGRRCRIYTRRPDVCNVEKTYDAQFRSRFTWPVYVALNLQACAELVKRQGEPGSMPAGDISPPAPHTAPC